MLEGKIRTCKCCKFFYYRDKMGRRLLKGDYGYCALRDATVHVSFGMICSEVFGYEEDSIQA